MTSVKILESGATIIYVKEKQFDFVVYSPWRCLSNNSKFDGDHFILNFPSSRSCRLQIIYSQTTLLPSKSQEPMFTAKSTIEATLHTYTLQKP